MNPTTPEIVKAAQRLKAGLLAHNDKALREMSRAYGQTWLQLKPKLDAVTKLIGQAEAVGKEAVARMPGSGVPLTSEQYSINWLARQERYRELMHQAEIGIIEYGKQSAVVVEREQAWGLARGKDDGQKLLELSMGPRPASVGSLSAAWNRIPDATLKNMVGFLADGSPLEYKFRALAPAVSEEIKGTIASGLAQGWNPRKIASAIERAHRGAFENTLVTCRTEVMRSYRLASQETYKANSDICKGWKWLSARNDRTCAGCWSMDGTVHALEEVLSDHPSGRCLVPGTLITGPLATAFTSRHYDGDIVVIHTADGKELSVTPNHPILTDRGWVAAGLLQEGDNVICDGRSQSGPGIVDPDEYHVPTRVEDVARSLGMDRLCRVPVATEDFHGDGGKSKVCVIWTNRLLRNDGDSTGQKPIGQLDFCIRSAAQSLLSRARNLASFFKRDLAGSAHSKRFLYSLAMFFRRESSRNNFGRFSLATEDGSCVLEPSMHEHSGSVKSLSQFKFSLASFVSLAQIRSGRRVLGPMALAQVPGFCSNLLRRSAGNSEQSAFAEVSNANTLGFKDASSNVGSDVELPAQGRESFPASVTFSERVSEWIRDRFPPALLPGDDTGIDQDSLDSVEVDVVSAPDLFECGSGLIVTDKIVSVESRRYRGQVYNLQTKDHWYIAAGIITHNCVAIPVTLSWDELAGKTPVQPAQDEDPTARFSKLKEADQRKVLGSTRYQLWKDGKLNLRDMAQAKPSLQWGLHYQPKPIKALVAEGKITKEDVDAARHHIGLRAVHSRSGLV